MSKTPLKGNEQNELRRNVFGWGDRGEKPNPHMDQGHNSLKTQTPESNQQYF